MNLEFWFFMLWLELGWSVFLLYLGINIGQREKSGIIIKHGTEARVAKGTLGPRPAIPEPDYVCENCGMLIKTGHKHTQQECIDYLKDPTKPDKRAHKVLLEGRNKPKIRLPFYYPDEETHSLATKVKKEREQ